MTDASMNKIYRENNPNIDPNEPNEIEIIAIKKPWCARNKWIYILIIISVLIAALGALAGAGGQKNNK